MIAPMSVRAAVGCWIVAIWVCGCSTAKRTPAVVIPSPVAARIAKIPVGPPPSPTSNREDDNRALLKRSKALFAEGRLEIALAIAVEVCDRGEWHGCAQAGGYFDDSFRVQSVGGSLNSFRYEVLALLDASCANNRREACEQLDRLLARRDTGLYRRTSARRDYPISDELPIPATTHYLCGKGRMPELCTKHADQRAASMPALAQELYDEACIGGDRAGCAAVARTYRGAGRRASALRSLERACDLDHVESCFNAAVMHREQTNMLEARRLYDRACLDDHGQACFDLAELAESGIGGERNLHDAIARYAKACSRGIQRGCVRAWRLEHQR